MRERKSSLEANIITARQAADWTGVASDRTFIRWAKAGKIPAIHLPNGQVRFRREDIEALLMPMTQSAEEPVSEEDAEIASQNTSEEFGEPLPGLEEFDR